MPYLDHAATSPPSREVLEAVWPYLVQVTANPASVHTPGQQARAGLEDARARAAAALGCRPGEVVFTSGGTEADDLAVLGLAPALAALPGRERHLVVSAVEHPAVLEPARALERRGWRLDVVGVDGEGRVDLAALAAAVTPRTALVSVMHANNEVGTVQPLAGASGVAALCAERGVALHVDAVQSAGLLDLAALWAQWWSAGPATGGVGAVSVSAHKIGGLRGSGLLAVRSGLPLEPLALGGGQERGRRSGTVDVASAVGLATALERAAARRGHEVPRLQALRDRLVAGVLAVAEDAGVLAQLTGAPLSPADGRLPGHASFVMPGLSGEMVLAELDLADVACSSGSACAAGSDDASHVLLAMGLDDDAARTAVRLTLGATSTDDDVDAVLAALPTALARAAGRPVPLEAP